MAQIDFLENVTSEFSLSLDAAIDIENSLIYYYQVEKWTAIILTFLFSSLGVCGYIFFISLLSKDRQQRFSNPFYELALSWSFCELYRVSQGFTVYLPMFIINFLETESTHVHVPKWYRVSSGFLSVIAWLSVLAHMLAMAANRLIAVYWPSNYNRLFTRTKCAVILLVSYFFAVFFTALLLFGGCRAEFIGYSWRVIAVEGSQSGYEEICSPTMYKIYLITCYGLLSITVIIIACAMLGMINFKRRFSERFRHRRLGSHQWSLSTQFALTILFLVITICVHWITPVFVHRNLLSQNVAAIIENTASIFICSLNPYIYIFMGSMVSRQIFGLHGNRNQVECRSIANGFIKRGSRNYDSSVC